MSDPTATTSAPATVVVQSVTLPDPWHEDMSKLAVLVQSRKFWTFVGALLAVGAYELHLLDAIAAGGIIVSCIGYITGVAIEDHGAAMAGHG